MSSGDHTLYDDTPGSIAKLRALLVKFPSMARELRANRRILRNFDIPYIAGISTDGRYVYIDRRLPREIAGIAVTPFLELHEAVERALRVGAYELGEVELRPYRSYEASHHLATAAEQMAVVSAGHSWSAYRDGLRTEFAPLEHEDIRRVPPDLLLYPYSGKLRERMEYIQARTKFEPEEVRLREATPVSPRECEHCWKFLRRTGRCIKVSGPIRPEQVCDKYEQYEETELYE